MATQSFAVTVGLGAGEHAPRIVTEPIDVGLSSVPYEYDLRAADPDQDPLRYQLVSGPDGLAVDPDSGTVTWGLPQGHGLQFNGRGDVALVPASSTLDPTNGFTLALWAKFDVLPSASGVEFFSNSPF
jgi:hypothetical protein